MTKHLDVDPASEQANPRLEELTEFARPDAVNLPLEKTEVSVLQIVDDVVFEYEQQALSRGLSLLQESRPGFPLLVFTDPVWLRQILVNLVSNALKFTNQGSIILRLSGQLSISNVPTEVVVEVIDTGVGISASHQATLFEQFYRASARTSFRFDGAALGLALSKRLALLLGGDLWLANSAEGMGSRFCLRLPVGPIPVPVLGRAMTPALQPITKIDFKNKSILLVEDDPGISQVTSMVLSEFGAAVQIASSGREAVSKVGSDLTGFDLILMDLRIPELDGIQATQQIRSLEYQGPIVALSADALFGTEERALTAGCNVFVSKPVELNLLLETIARFLEPNEWPSPSPLNS